MTSVVSAAPAAVAVLPGAWHIADAEALYERMKSRDFSVILDTAISEFGVKSPERAEELLDAFLQWFALIPSTADGRPLQMLRSVDRIWHAMIVNTAFYRTFCIETVGEFIDHNPLDVVRDAEAKQEYADHTLALLKSVYEGRINPALCAINENVTCCCGCYTRQ